MNLSEISLTSEIMTQQLQSEDAVINQTFHGKDLEEVAQEFESVFINQMLKALDQTVQREGNILYAGRAEDMYRGLLNQETAMDMAKGRGIGISEMIMQQLGKTFYADANTQEGRSFNGK